MSAKILYRRRVGRTAYFREWMAGRALRRRTIDFTTTRPICAIVGDAVSDVIRAEGIYEREFLHFLRDRVIEPDPGHKQVALDVGANIGNHSLFFSDLFARVIAFEPNPLARSLLHMNLELNGIGNVDVRPVGLSDQPGLATLSFDYANIGGATSSSGASRQGTRREQIELVVGDETINASEPVGLIKVDVEGQEERVLRGLERTIRSNQPIVMIEQWEDVIDSGTSASFSFLSDLGYSAWELRPSRLFRGKLGKISSLLLGRADYRLDPVDRLEKRKYSALFFLPPERLKSLHSSQNALG